MTEPLSRQEGKGLVAFNCIMERKLIIFSLVLTACSALAQQDHFYVPKNVKKPAPALIITSCTGATSKDLDSNRAVADSLGWVICTPAKTRNHRDARLNDADIMDTYRTLVAKYPVDRSKIFIYGFSGQAVQAMLAVFQHPGEFRGAVAICAHAGAMPSANWETLKGKHFYLISREQDWNLLDNRKMHQASLENGIRDTLVITPGKHGPKTRRELFEGCRWLNGPHP